MSLIKKCKQKAEVGGTVRHTSQSLNFPGYQGTLEIKLYSKSRREHNPNGRFKNSFLNQ
jgi:hypothetical protein